MRNHLIFDHDLSWTTKYFLSEDYVMPEWRPPDPKVLMLPPPKRFLKEHSVYNTSPNTVYVFTQDKATSKADVCNIHLYKVRIYEQPGKIQLIRVNYYFDRKHDIMKEQKRAFKVITYLPDKRALYIIKNKATGLVTKKHSVVPKKYMRTTKRVSLNHIHIQGLSSFPTNYVKRWSDAIFDAVRRDVPDVCDDATTLEQRLIAFMIQHRVGRGIPGLNSILIGNLANVSAQNFAVQLTNKQHRNTNLTAEESNRAIIKAAKAYKNQTVYKFLPVLKKTGSTKKAFKALFGKHYFNMLGRIMTMLPFGLPVEESAEFISRYKKDVPTIIKHMLTKCINNKSCFIRNGSNIHTIPNNNNNDTLWLMKETISMLIDTNNVEYHVIDNWARTMLRLKQRIAWYLWRDMYDMSITVGRRIRPAQFNTIAEIEYLHNQFNHIIGNMDIPVSGIPPELLTFLGADVPSTLMDGKYIVKQLVTHAELEEESQTMGHCIRSYSRKCATGKSIIISLQDEYGNRIYTLEYAGHNFKYMQGEGPIVEGVRTFPSDLEVDNILIPLGAEITKREAQKALNYEIRAKLELHKQKMWYDVEQLEYFPNWIQRGLKCVLVDEINSARILERCNRNIERLIEIDKMIANGVIGEVIFNKIGEIEQAKEKHNWMSNNIPAGVPLPPIPAAWVALGRAHHIEECVDGATL